MELSSYVFLFTVFALVILVLGAVSRINRKILLVGALALLPIICLGMYWSLLNHTRIEPRIERDCTNDRGLRQSPAD